MLIEKNFHLFSLPYLCSIAFLLSCVFHSLLVTDFLNLQLRIQLPILVCDIFIDQHSVIQNTHSFFPAAFFWQEN